MAEPKFRGYYERLRHKAAIAAMQSLVIDNPDRPFSAIAQESIKYADALMNELQLTEAVEEVPD